MMRANIYMILSCLLLYAGMGLADDADSTTVGAENESLKQPLALPTLPPREEFDGILQRPLFSVNRRPEQEANTDSLISARELRETWRLTGIIMIGEENKALLRERNGERHLLLSVGMPLDNSWVLDQISPDGVVMDSGDEQVRLDLLEPRDTEPVAPEQASEQEQSAGQSETRPLDESAREAVDRLRQETQTMKEERNE